MIRRKRKEEVAASLEAANKALEQSHRSLQDAQRTGDYLERLMQGLSRINLDNNFAPKLERAYAGGKN